MDNDLTKYVKGNIGELSQLDQDRAKLLKSEVCKPRINNYTTIKLNEELNNVIEQTAEKREEEHQLLKSIANDTKNISLNTDKLIFSTDDLIEAVKVSSKITEGNLALIERELEFIKNKEGNDLFLEVEKAVIALTVQSGIPTAFAFLLKFIKGLA